jgi:chromosome segregation ATPase
VVVKESDSMATANATQALSIDEIQGQIQRFRNERKTIENELKVISEKKAIRVEKELEQKRELAAGDKSASAALDALDGEIRDLSRREDGLRLLANQIDARITPLQQQANLLRRVLDDEKTAAEFKEDCADAEAVIEKCDSDVASACLSRAEAYLRLQRLKDKYGADGMAAGARIILERLNNPLYRLQKKGWDELSASQVTSVFVSSIMIRPLVPPNHPAARPKPRQFTGARG